MVKFVFLEGICARCKDPMKKIMPLELYEVEHMPIFCPICGAQVSMSVKQIINK